MHKEMQILLRKLKQHAEQSATHKFKASNQIHIRCLGQRELSWNFCNDGLEKMADIFDVISNG